MMRIPSHFARFLCVSALAVGGLAGCGAEECTDEDAHDAGADAATARDTGNVRDTAIGRDTGIAEDTGTSEDVVSDTTPDPTDGGTDVGQPDTAEPEPDATESDVAQDTGPAPASPGCGRAAIDATGGVQVTIDAGPDGAGTRGFYLSLPSDYDPNREYRLIVGYSGTNWVGQEIQPYLNLEDGARNDEIFVYPDPLWWDFEGWGNLGGWILGPYASPANGNQDIVFTEALLDYMENNYCIDTNYVFSTGHSWGGDMSQVVSCFLGDRFTASVPVAANRPYWFEPDGEGNGWLDCEGDTAVWTLFGEADDHFSWQDYSGQFGDECRDFWLDQRDCEGSHAYDYLPWGDGNECVEFRGCSSRTLYCLYGPDSRHQVPSYFSALANEFFRSF